MPSPQLENIGLALQGFGAGVQGNLPQFISAQNQNQNQQQEMQLRQQGLQLQQQEFAQRQQQAQQQQQEAQQKLQQQVMAESYKDAAIFNSFAKKGDWKSAQMVGMSFLQHAQQLAKNGIQIPQDAVEHAQTLTKLAIAAMNKDHPDEAEEASKLALDHSGTLVEQGRGLGILEKPKGESSLGRAAQDLRDGLITQDEYKALVAKETAGADSAFLTEQKRQDELLKMLEKDPNNKRLQQQLQDVTDHISELARPGTKGDKAPAGYQYKPDGTLEPIKGGPADKENAQMGAREQVFLQRVLLSANEASKDLSNIVELPTTASTGMFGGRRQGVGLLEATKEVMANKMTGQDAQSYNTLASGFQRALAGIESAGLAPTNALSHQMDAVLFKEGDTNLTKLQKMAQIRQIVEAGLESTLANPRMPEAQRKHAEEVIASLRKSVPFTQKDLLKLQVEQEQNPNMTLKELMQSTNGPKAGTVEEGYRFKGGNPADKNNWEKI